jgi:integrase
VFASTRKLFGWCVEHGLLDRSPCDGLRAPGKERSPDRVLTNAELKAVWRTCGQLNEPWPGLFRLLIANGRRRGEVTGMKWDHLDIDRGWWTIPPELARNGRPHTLPLAPLIVWRPASLRPATCSPTPGAEAERRLGSQTPRSSSAGCRA